jgi:hypothetical protein
MVNSPKGRDQFGDVDLCCRTILLDFKEVGCEGVDWINLAQDRVHWHGFVNSAMNLRVPSKARKFFAMSF